MTAKKTTTKSTAEGLAARARWVARQWTAVADDLDAGAAVTPTMERDLDVALRSCGLAGWQRTARMMVLAALDDAPKMRAHYIELQPWIEPRFVHTGREGVQAAREVLTVRALHAYVRTSLEVLFPDVAAKLTDETLTMMLRIWETRGAPKSETSNKWRELARVFARVGLPVAPVTLGTDWNKWRARRGVERGGRRRPQK